MEQALNATEITVLGWSVVLLLVQIAAQAVSSYDLGPNYLMGPRDQNFEPTGKIAGRAKRASANFRETYPAFIGLALALAMKGDVSGWGIGGAWLWFACRIAYIPLYLAGVPYIRSLAWSRALEGMQPILRQVPPRVGAFSTTATFMPSWAALMAAT